MDDPVSELRHCWCQKYYSQKYTIPYKWTYGKEDKLLKGLIEWAQGAFGDSFQERLAEGFRAYLMDEDTFLTKKKHLFSDFAANPHRWLSTKPQKPAIAEVHLPQENPPWTDLELCTRIAENPITWIRGFKLMHKTLEKCCPAAYERLKHWIPEVVGKDRARAIWKKSNVDNFVFFSKLEIIETVNEGGDEVQSMDHDPTLLHLPIPGR